MAYACIFVPDFFVEAIVRAEPELRSQAVAVAEGKSPLDVRPGVPEMKSSRPGCVTSIASLYLPTWLAIPMSWIALVVVAI